MGIGVKRFAEPDGLRLRFRGICGVRMVGIKDFTDLLRLWRIALDAAAMIRVQRFADLDDRGGWGRWRLIDDG